MTKRKVIITDCDHPSVEIEKQVLNGIQAEVELLQCKTEEDLLEHCREADGLINQYAPLTRRVLSELKRCKVIARYGVGVDNVDLQAASDYGIQICNVPDYGVQEVSDHALALMLSLTRKTFQLGNAVKKGVWDFSISRPIYRLQEQVVGVVGLGRIGRAFAEKVHGLGMQVIGYDQYPESFSRVPFVKQVRFDELLSTADIISIHCPLTEETYHLFGEEQLRMMKPQAYLINTARGPIVDERALDKALGEGWIAGAGLDVLEMEPPGLDHPLFRHESFLATPHAAFYSEQSFAELKRKAAEEVARVLTGESPRYPVNRLGENG
jgi:D-3-phosphoglycerate dehydrogenase